MKLELTYYGNPILRKKGAIVTPGPEIKELVDGMVEIMHKRNGIGIAAPQVGHSLALFIVQVPVEAEDETVTPGRLLVFLNPKILEHSEEVWGHNEGCLSIPGVYESVDRPLKIKVEATDLDGNRFTEVFEGWEARVILHENDHINGTLFIDRLDKKTRQKIEPTLREIKKRHQ